MNEEKGRVMKPNFDGIVLTEVQREVFRNIVSIKQSQDLFDDLSQDPQDWLMAQAIEAEIKPPSYVSDQPVINRPFEDAIFFNSIVWPFRHWSRSRFSDGTFGVWYGSHELETTVYETAYHWYHGFIKDAGFENEAVVLERKVYEVQCHAALLNFCARVKDEPALIHPSDYNHTQAIGKKIYHEGHPGLLTYSARHEIGVNQVIFNSQVLSKPKPVGYLIYRLENQQINVEKSGKKKWLLIDLQND
jgi:hypothetical protein